jgi:hypothetical protein
MTFSSSYTAGGRPRVNRPADRISVLKELDLLCVQFGITSIPAGVIRELADDSRAHDDNLLSMLRRHGVLPRG